MKKIVAHSPIVLFSLILAGFLSPACYYDNETDLYPNSANCDTSAVSYATHIAPMIASNCATTGCHDASAQSGGVLLENYGNVRAKVDDGRINQRVLIDKTMPPMAPLTSCNINLLQAWIHAGAPNN